MLIDDTAYELDRQGATGVYVKGPLDVEKFVVVRDPCKVRDIELAEITFEVRSKPTNKLTATDDRNKTKHNKPNQTKPSIRPLRFRYRRR